MTTFDNGIYIFNIIDTNSASIYEYIGSSTVIIIPDIIKYNNIEYKIIKIDDDVFMDKEITQLSFIGSNLTVIGSYAFAFNYLKQDIPYIKNDQIELIIPKSVKNIGIGAFLNRNIRSNNLFEEGSILEIISDGAFRWDVTNINDIQMKNDPPITVNIPASVLTIGYNAFYNRDITSKMLFPENSQLTDLKIKSFYWDVKDSTGKLLSNSPINIVIPNKILKIQHNTFYNRNISNLSFKESIITDIDSRAFFWNESILDGYGSQSPALDLIIPKSAININDFAFSGRNIVGLKIEDNSNLEFIKAGAFQTLNYNSSPITLKIPKKLKVIGYISFYNRYIKNLIFSQDSEINKIESNAFNIPKNTADNKLIIMNIPKDIKIESNSFVNYLIEYVKVDEEIEYHINTDAQNIIITYVTENKPDKEVLEDKIRNTFNIEIDNVNVTYNIINMNNFINTPNKMNNISDKFSNTSYNVIITIIPKANTNINDLSKKINDSIETLLTIPDVKRPNIIFIYVIMFLILLFGLIAWFYFKGQ